MATKTFKSATSEVLNYLKTHKKGITSKEAFTKFGVTRLSGIIFNLRNQGYNITTNTEEQETRYGYTVNFARYTLD